MAENETKWQKQPSGWEWRKRTDAYKAEIAKVTGSGTGRPYRWDVYPLPRPQGLVRYMPMAKGSCAKLAEAKAAADSVIAAITAPEPRAD